MNKKLALKNSKNQVIRVFHWETEKAFVVYRNKTGRLEVYPSFDFSEQEKAQLTLIQKVQKDHLTQKKQPVTKELYLELLDTVGESLSPSKSSLSDSSKDFQQTAFIVAGGVALCISMLFAFRTKNPEEKRSEVIEPQTVKILNTLKITYKPKKVLIGSHFSLNRSSKMKTKKPKKKSLKQMGVLAAFGSLVKSHKTQTEGLNLGASRISKGPGLKASSTRRSGSGGIQSSLYSKGLITASLGASGNIKGGGGYGTKGQTPGGGQAGQGQLSLIGSQGSGDLSETSHLKKEGGGFDPLSIEREIMKHIGKIRKCYDTALRFTPDLKGLFKIQFFLNKKGKVMSSKTHSSSPVQSRRLADCILPLVNAIKFPDGDYPERIPLVYPFDLKALEGG